MKAVIFGASGQDGFYLKQLLDEKGVETVCISRSGGDVIGDVADRAFVDEIIKSSSTDYIFHLAANSTVRHDAMFGNHDAISTGTLNILESVYRHRRDARVFLSGSVLQFENSADPIDENTPFAAFSPYAMSRIHSVYAGRYFRTLKMKVYVGYFFHHDSPLRNPDHINQRIALAARRGATIEIGDITVRKEFNFAGDIMEAVWLLVNQDEFYEAVIGSGSAHSIEEWLKLCYSEVGKNWRDYVTVKENFVADFKVLVSKPDLIKSLGWKPKVDICELAKLMTKGHGA